ncbi:MAG TPA: HAD family hydrolase [Phycisphaerae bacterium]|nr:HAD family hydrolase [Phycisphaerae bacterium]
MIFSGWNCFYRGLMPGVTQMLAELAKSVRLIALTNTNPGHAAVWKKMFADTLESFERIFCSHEISTRKPEAQSYQIALDYLGIEGARAVFVDDKIKNVKAAEAMGMKGIVAADTESTMEKLRNLGAI